MISHKTEPQALLHCEDFDLKKVKFNFENTGLNKPILGLWTSTWNDDTPEISWVNWRLHNTLNPHCVVQRHNTLYRIYPKKNYKFKIFEINRERDYRHKWLSKESSQTWERYDLIDFNKMHKKNYTGIHFTQNGADLGNHENLTDYHIKLALYPISVESTIWFNVDWIDKVELIYTDIFKEFKWLNK